MTPVETIAGAVVELARFALIGFAVKNGRDVLIHWLNRLPPSPADILDAFRAAGVDLQQLADRRDA